MDYNFSVMAVVFLSHASESAQDSPASWVSMIEIFNKEDEIVL